MIKRILAGLFVFISFWLLFLVATLPVSVVWERIPNLESQLKKSGVKVLAVDGTVWQGRMHVRYQVVEGIISWDTAAMGLLTLQLPVHVLLESNVGDANIDLSVGTTEQMIQVNKASIDLSLLSPMLKRQKVTLEGDLIFQNVKVAFTERMVSHASGRVAWSGGEITYPKGRRVGKSQVPSFQGILTMQDEMVAHLGLRDSGASFDVIDATLDQQGEAFLKVRRRLFDVIDEVLPANYKDETDVVFKVKKKIL